MIIKKFSRRSRMGGEKRSERKSLQPIWISGGYSWLRCRGRARLSVRRSFPAIRRGYFPAPPSARARRKRNLSDLSRGLPQSLAMPKTTVLPICINPHVTNRNSTLVPVRKPRHVVKMCVKTEMSCSTWERNRVCFLLRSVSG